MVRVFVSGFGIVSPLGIGKDAFFQGLREGRVAIRRMDSDLDLTGIEAKVAAPCDSFDPLASFPPSAPSAWAALPRWPLWPQNSPKKRRNSLRMTGERWWWEQGLVPWKSFWKTTLPF